jgi:hypothetical protein
MKLYFKRRIIMDKAKTAVVVVKTVGCVAISIGIGAVAANLIRVTTPADVKKITKIFIGVGSFFTAGLAASAASSRFGTSMDIIMKLITKFTQENNDTGEKIVVEGEA